MAPVDVYFNLHRKVWSLRCRRSGLVIGHHRVVVFPMGATMVVQAAGRERVLSTNTKTVHAFVRGIDPELSDFATPWQVFGRTLPDATRVTYNPHRAGFFTRKDNGERIDRATALVMVAPENAAPEVWAVAA